MLSSLIRWSRQTWRWKTAGSGFWVDEHPYQDYEEPPSENTIREFVESFDSLYPRVYNFDFEYSTD